MLGFTFVIFHISSLDTRETESGEVRRTVVRGLLVCSHEISTWVLLWHSLAPATLPSWESSLFLRHLPCARHNSGHMNPSDSREWGLEGQDRRCRTVGGRGMGSVEVRNVKAWPEGGKCRTGHRLEGSGLPRWPEGTAGII